jgi:hypothetical protein
VPLAALVNAEAVLSANAIIPIYRLPEPARLFRLWIDPAPVEELIPILMHP